MPSKTKTKTFAEILEDSEAAYRAEQAAIREELASSGTAITAAEKALEEAQERLEDVQADVAVGDVPDPGTALAHARGEVEAAELYLKAVQRRLRALRARQGSTQVDAALGLVNAVRAVLPGVPVHVCAGPVPLEVDPGELPLVIIQQRQPSTEVDGTTARRRANGVTVRHLPIDVQVVQFRAAFHRPLDVAVLHRALVSTGTNADVLSVSKDLRDDHGVLRDVALLSTRSSAPSPAVLAYDEGAAPQVARRVANKIASNTRRVVDSTTVRHVETVTGDGVRKTTVSGQVLLKAPGYGSVGKVKREEGLYGITYTPTHVERVEDLVGTLVPGLGRIVTASSDHVDPDSFDFTVKLVSRVDYSTPHPPIV